MRTFDPLIVHLRGQSLIEASAGTGKTYNITFLYLRLVAELGLEVDRILVVTFTEAATAELRDKVRGAIAEGIRALEDPGGATGDMARFESQLAGDRDVALGRLRKALLDFDQAAISTIHGFCRRVLDENAFESGAPFSVEMVGDQAELCREIAEDYWVRKMFEAPPFLVSMLDRRRVGSDYLAKLVARVTSQPELRVVAEKVDGDGVDYVRAYERAREIWRSDGARVRDVVLNDPGINRKKYIVKSIHGWFDYLEGFFARSEPRMVPERSGDKKPPAHDVVWRFAASQISMVMKKNCQAPRHGFFDACDKLLDEASRLDGLVADFKVGAVEYAREQLSRRKEERGILFFDDLLNRLSDALADEHRGPSLVARIRSRFGAVLIDEFQDTDRVQYSIFQRVFGGGEYPFFMIGDPKQSIYAFRGGDIFTYLQAAGEVGNGVYTLGTNWRSDPGLVRAVNYLFGKLVSPFLYDRIGFQEVAARPDSNDCLRINGGRVAPLQIGVVRRRQGEKEIPKAWAIEHLASLVAEDISELLCSGATIDGREDPRVGPGDIAVLVPKNDQAAVLQEALSGLGINSVLWSDKSVFSTEEAQEVGRVLQAVAEPSSYTRVKAALATSLMGMNAAELWKLEGADNSWNRWVEIFKVWRDLWVERGFTVMFRSVMDLEMDGEKVGTRVLAGRSGERRATNLAHLSELLHREERERRLGPNALIRWLLHNIADEGKASDEAQIRLESDRNAVRLVTLHKSKGLQYPVVYLPFMWDSKIYSGADGDLAFHDPEDNWRARIDLSNVHDEKLVALAVREEMAENLRKLYVGITRAQHMCKVAWGRFRYSDTSALGYLLHNSSGGLSSSAVTRLLGEMDDDQLIGRLEELAMGSDGSVEIGEMETSKVVGGDPVERKEVEFAVRRMTRPVPPPMVISSFTRLASKAEKTESFELEGVDRDGDQSIVKTALSEERSEEERIPLADFEASARAGSCLHEILEHADFQAGDARELEGLISSKLGRYGFDVERWGEPVAHMMMEVLGAPLDDGEPGLTLSSLGAGSRISEMEFLLPVKKMGALNGAAVARVMAMGRDRQLPEDYDQALRRLGFAPFEGFLTGFIDLVFEHGGRWYVADYKSNHLGDQPSGYDTEFLETPMAEHHYFLQYHLYTVALHRYLSGRLPDYDYDTHMGGAFYLFLRGMSRSRRQGIGIFRDRPSKAAIESLSRLFGGES